MPEGDKTAREEKSCMDRSASDRQIKVQALSLPMNLAGFTARHLFFGRFLCKIKQNGNLNQSVSSYIFTKRREKPCLFP